MPQVRDPARRPHRGGARSRGPRRRGGVPVYFLEHDRVLRPRRRSTGRATATTRTTASGSCSSAGPRWKPSGRSARSGRLARRRPRQRLADRAGPGVPARAVPGPARHRAPRAPLFTIHNIAYQGMFWPRRDADHRAAVVAVQPDQLEFHGQVQLPQGGHRLRRRAQHGQPDLRAGDPDRRVRLRPRGRARASASADLHGIVNGVDYDDVEPRDRPHLAASASTPTTSSGKAACKRALRRERGLTPSRRAAARHGHAARRAEGARPHRCDALPALLADGRELVLLGAGDGATWRTPSRAAAAEHPGRVSGRARLSTRRWPTGSRRGPTAS